VGAVSDQARAQQYQQRLSQQFSVPGRVMQNGAVWRIQLGPLQQSAGQRRSAAPAKRSAAAVLYYSRQLNAAGRPFTSRM
jgi:hypothetical protein